MIQYRHTQPGHAVTMSLGIAAVLLTLISGLAAPGDDVFLFSAIMVSVLLLIWLLFGWLTVTITDTHLQGRFGIGLFRFRIALSDIESVREVGNRWYMGWGIHRIRRGWLYNVSGFGAIEIVVRGSRIVRVGSDEPRALALALQSCLEAKAQIARSSKL